MSTIKMVYRRGDDERHSPAALFGSAEKRSYQVNRSREYVPLDATSYGPTKTIYKLLFPVLNHMLRRKGLQIVRPYQFDRSLREQGHDWPPEAETMVGLKRLSNLQECITDVLRSGVPGDFLEAGVWRGGCSIFAKAVLTAYGDASRSVWLADSFEGLPKPDAANYPVDAGDILWTKSEILAVSLEEVQQNFRRYGLLDERVRFIKGWFKDTMPSLPANRFAILRLDGDMYESTIQVLEAAYPRLSAGGYAIIDDYPLKGCKTAVDDYRKAHGISYPITMVDWSGAYWQHG